MKWGKRDRDVELFGLKKVKKKEKLWKLINDSINMIKK